MKEADGDLKSGHLLGQIRGCRGSCRCRGGGVRRTS